jgi:hypothetical protein
MLESHTKIYPNAKSLCKDYIIWRIMYIIKFNGRHDSNGHEILVNKINVKYYVTSLAKSLCRHE